GTCTVTINSGGGSGFNPEMTPMTISVTSNGVVREAGESVLTVPQGANYAVSFVNFTIPNVQEIGLSDNIIDYNGNEFATGLTSWLDVETSTSIQGLKITPNDSSFFDTTIQAIGTQGADGYTATGTATVTITDLTNGVSAVKEITVNFTYQQG
ncbi:MAG: hypothetical protein U0L93_01515, partial [Bacteroidales bacterium]|nr:hypothetical protein [Bacteroidales bacterium]